MGVKGDGDTFGGIIADDACDDTEDDGTPGCAVSGRRSSGYETRYGA